MLPFVNSFPFSWAAWRVWYWRYPYATGLDGTNGASRDYNERFGGPTSACTGRECRRFPFPESGIFAPVNWVVRPQPLSEGQSIWCDAIRKAQ